jgi:hypothetical protein
MTPIEAMTLAFEASGGDEPSGFEGRLLAALHSLGWGVVPFVPEYDDHPGESHEFLTSCRRCGERGFLHVALITDKERVVIEANEP